MTILFKFSAVLCAIALVACEPNSTKTGDAGIAQISVYLSMPKVNPTVGKTYEQKFLVENGKEPLAWKVTVPAGFEWLSIDAATGVLKGVPTAPFTPSTDAKQSDPIEIQVTDANGAVGTLSLLLSVLPCTTGDTVECRTTVGSKCMKGARTCQGQVFGECRAGTDKADSNECPPVIHDKCGSGSACTAGKICCEGLCVDPNNDVDHCGGCNACDSDRSHVLPACVAGTCTYDCEPGWARCPEGIPRSECNMDITQKENCGGCGNVCNGPAGVSLECKWQEKKCRISSCPDPNYGDCDGRTDNGCETDLRSNNDYCGSCDTACPKASFRAIGPAKCENSKCVNNCLADETSGYGDCDGDPFNGCETDLLTDVNNCGKCGQACPSTYSRKCDQIVWPTPGGVKPPGYHTKLEMRFDCWDARGTCILGDPSHPGTCIGKP